MEAQVGLLLVDIYIPEAETLKHKRQVVRSLLDRAAARFNVSVAEIDHLNNCRRALIAFAIVSNQISRLRHVLDGVRGLVENEPRAEIVEAVVEIL